MMQCVLPSPPAPPRTLPPPPPPQTHTHTSTQAHPNPHLPRSYLNDIVEVNTRTGVVRRLAPAGAPPDPRAYHALAAAGSCCLVLAGRAGSSRLVKGRQLVAAYDAAANKWLAPGGWVGGWVGGGPLPSPPGTLGIVAMASTADCPVDFL
jgi:hypothetical protein